MFVVTALVKPLPDKEKEMADPKRSFRDLLRTKPGLVQTAVLSELQENTLVGLSMWTDQTAKNRPWRVFSVLPPRSLLRRSERLHLLCGYSSRSELVSD